MNDALLRYCNSISFVVEPFETSIKPFGLVHTVSTITGISTDGGRYTAQVRVNVTPANMSIF